MKSSDGVEDIRPCARIRFTLQLDMLDCPISNAAWEHRHLHMPLAVGPAPQ
jgi:hypothetical protein